jgi:hypothetical protein
MSLLKSETVVGVRRRQRSVSHCEDSGGDSSGVALMLAPASAVMYDSQNNEFLAHVAFFQSPDSQ